jgi:hypothetical protein
LGPWEDSGEGSWLQSHTRSQTHLDGERDVSIGTEAPATVTGTVVESAPWGRTDGGTGQGWVEVPPTGPPSA